MKQVKHKSLNSVYFELEKAAYLLAAAGDILSDLIEDGRVNNDMECWKDTPGGWERLSDTELSISIDYEWIIDLAKKLKEESPI